VTELDDRGALEQRLARFAWLLDSSIRIPGTRFRLGLESLLGLIPGIGDVAGVLLALYIVAGAARLGASKATLLRMGGNIGIETLIGLVPLVGDLFDMRWKANERNMRLLRRHGAAPERAARADRRALLGVLAALLLLSCAIVAAGVWVLVAIGRAL